MSILGYQPNGAPSTTADLAVSTATGQPRTPGQALCTLPIVRDNLGQALPIALPSPCARIIGAGDLVRLETDDGDRYAAQPLESADGALFVRWLAPPTADARRVTVRRVRP